MSDAISVYPEPLDVVVRAVDSIYIFRADGTHSHTFRAEAERDVVRALLAAAVREMDEA